MLAALALVLLPLVLGVLAGRGGWLTTATLGHPASMAALNRFALLFAFPALVIASFIDPSRTHEIALPVLVLAAVPLLIGATVSVALGHRVIGGERLPSGGALALVALFGNSAYLGLPLVSAVVGESLLATASTIVSVHVALTVTLGTTLLERREGASFEPLRALKQLLTSPLAMSPVVGLIAAWVLEASGTTHHPATHAAFRALDALGKTASPLGIFVLGLFLGERGLRARGGHEGVRGQLAFAFVRLIVVPGTTLLLAWALEEVWPLPRDTVRTLLLLAAMPAAISTFAMAEEARVDPQAVASAVVYTSLLSVATLPMWMWLLDAIR